MRAGALTLRVEGWLSVGELVRVRVGFFFTISPYDYYFSYLGPSPSRESAYGA